MYASEYTDAMFDNSNCADHQHNLNVSGKNSCAHDAS